MTVYKGFQPMHYRYEMVFAPEKKVHTVLADPTIQPRLLFAFPYTSEHSFFPDNMKNVREYFFKHIKKEAEIRIFACFETVPDILLYDMIWEQTDTGEKGLDYDYSSPDCIRIMPEWGGSYDWFGLGDNSRETPEISKQLYDDFIDWLGDYELSESVREFHPTPTYNGREYDVEGYEDEDGTIMYGYYPDTDWAAFNKQGIALAERYQQEVGDNFLVYYAPEHGLQEDIAEPAWFICKVES